MGSELSCPCAGKTIESENTPKPQIQEAESVKIKARIDEEDILYNYCYGLTKINLIKTSNLEKFFNCRTLLKLQNRKEGNDYYDKIFISNYMGNKDITAIIMQYTQMPRKSLTNGKDLKGKKKITPDYNAKYSVEDLVFFTHEKDKNIMKLSNDLNTKIKKNFIFLGLVTDTDLTNKNYKMLYKASLSDKTNIEYIVDIYEDDFNEQLIEDFLNNRSNKRSILKSILIDKNEYEESDSSRTTPTSNGNKNETTLYFIYEDDPTDQNYYDYNVIKMSKDNTNKDGYIKDLISKLNDFQQAFTLTNFFSDENSIFFFMIMPINMTPTMTSFI